MEGALSGLAVLLADEGLGLASLISNSLRSCTNTSVLSKNSRDFSLEHTFERYLKLNDSFPDKQTLQNLQLGFPPKIVQPALIC
jgi:hypothetical protein